MPYRWLLFDADGTLFDYDRGEAAALEEAWAETGLPAPTGLVASYRRINAELWRAYEEGGISQRDLQVERFVRLAVELEQPIDAMRLSRGYLRHLSGQTALVDGARELLASLAGEFDLALITNGIPEVQRPRIERSGLDRLFPVVVISGEVGFAKPAREIFDVALAQMGSPLLAEVLLVGDSLSSDVRGGVEYGLDTCWFNPAGLAPGDGPKPRWEIRRLDELPAILDPGG